MMMMMPVLGLVDLLTIRGSVGLPMRRHVDHLTLGSLSTGDHVSKVTNHVVGIEDDVKKQESELSDKWLLEEYREVALSRVHSSVEKVGVGNPR